MIISGIPIKNFEKKLGWGACPNTQSQFWPKNEKSGLKFRPIGVEYLDKPPWASTVQLAKKSYFYLINSTWPTLIHF